MPQVELDQASFDKLAITARLTGKSVGAVVAMLLDRLATEEPHIETATPSDASQTHRHESTDKWVLVHKVYKGNRLDGKFNPSTMELRVETAPWNGRVFPSPTAAAVAVVEHFPSDRETSSTNGRKFWRVNRTGHDLRSIVGQR